MEIARAIDRLGGDVDAFTTKEYTGFYVHTLDSRFAEALDLLGDVVLAPAFDAARRRERARSDPGGDRRGQRQPGGSRPRDLRGRVLEGPSARRADPGNREDRPRHLAGRPLRLPPQPIRFGPLDRLGGRASARGRRRRAIERTLRRAAPGRAAGSSPGTAAARRARALRCTGARGLEQAHLCLGLAAPAVHEPAALRGEPPRHRPGRRHVLAPLSGDPREARPRLLDRLVAARLPAGRLRDDLGGVRARRTWRASWR